MNEPVETLLFGLDKLDMLLRMYTRDFGAEHWSARPGDSLHSAHWILAHLALSLNQEAGAERVFSEELDKAFDFGAPGTEDPATWPGVEELQASFAAGRAALAERWRARTQEEWLAPVPENRLGMKNKAQGAMFVLEHAVYHVGQLGAIRRMLGLKGVV
ncbi:MAG: DinB family protein [Candidatus Delongbacteria bacterium]